MSKIHMTPRWKDVKPSGHYVYIHCRATDGRPFYIGKGQNFRAWGKAGRGRWWEFCASKNGVLVTILADRLSEDQAHALEVELIAEYREKGHELVNLSAGGEGCSGHPSSARKTVYCSNGMVFDSTIDACNWVRQTTGEYAVFSAIAAAASGVHFSAYGLAWSYDNQEPVYVCPGVRRANHFGINVVTDCGLNFPSMQDAARWCKDNGYPSASSSKISLCCSGKRKKAYGRVWRLA